MVNFDVKLNTALTLTTILSTSEIPANFAIQIGVAMPIFSFHAAPEDVVEEVRPRLADEDDGPLYIPQFTGCWWGLRDVLRKAGFEDVTEEGLTFARKTFQAAAVTENGGQPWLQAFIQALAEIPLLVTFEPSMKFFKEHAGLALCAATAAAAVSRPGIRVRSMYRQRNMERNWIREYCTVF